MKLNKKGFTLIELLAVVTIMGILMLVAIPAIARTIENTRRDTFNDTAKKYINAIQTEIIADQLTCGDLSVSATLAGYYYFPISTSSTENNGLGDNDITQQTQDLLESGGKSSWGKNDVVGAVLWKKENSARVSATDDSGFKITYYVFLVDKGNHGISTVTEKDKLTRSKVLTNTNKGTASVNYVSINSLDQLKSVLMNHEGDMTGLKNSENQFTATQCSLQ